MCAPCVWGERLQLGGNSAPSACATAATIPHPHPRATCGQFRWLWADTAPAFVPLPPPLTRADTQTRAAVPHLPTFFVVAAAACVLLLGPAAGGGGCGAAQRQAAATPLVHQGHDVAGEGLVCFFFVGLFCLFKTLDVPGMNLVHQDIRDMMWHVRGSSQLA